MADKDTIIDFNQKKKDKNRKQCEGMMSDHSDDLSFFTKHIMALFNYIAYACEKRGYKFILSVTLDEKENLYISQSNDPDYIKSIFPDEPV